MSYIGKPKVVHPKLPRNKLGLSKRDYEGVASTLCAGCGHDSITAAIIQAVFELDIEPHKLAKMSGMRPCTELNPCDWLTKYAGVLDEQPMPLIFASLCGSISSSNTA